MRAPLIAALLVVSAACRSPMGPTETALTVLPSEGSLQLHNTSGQRTFYFTYEREAAAVINWAPCVDSSRCPALEAGSRTSIPYAAIGGYEQGKSEAILWWWVATGPAGRAEPGRIHHVVVRL